MDASSEPPVAMKAWAALDEAERAAHAKDVVPWLCHEDSATRDAAVSFFELCSSSASEAASAIAKNLSLPDGRFSSACAVALGHIKAQSYAGEVAKLLDSSYVDTVSVAFYAAGIEPKLPVVLRRTACAAAFALSLMGEEGAKYAGDVAGKLSAPDLPADAKACFIAALGPMQAAGQQAQILSYLSNPAAQVRAAAAEALGELVARGVAKDSADVAEALGAKLKDPHPVVRQAAVKALSRMTEEVPLFTDAVADLFKDRVPAVQIEAVQAMVVAGEKGQMYARQVAMLLTSDVPDVRLTAVEALAAMDRRGAAFVDEIVPLMQDESEEVRNAATAALVKMNYDGSQ